MKSYKDLILFALVIIGSAAAGIWVLEQSKQHPELLKNEQVSDIAQGDTINRIPYGEQDDQTQEEKQIDKTIETQFENMLNDFLQRLNEKSLKYKKTRQAVSDLIKPANIRAASFLPENKSFAQSMVIEMETQMDDIISTFDDADQEIRALVTANPSADKTMILTKWINVKNERMENYMSFFLLEKDYLDKHIQVLDLLIQTQNQYDVDVANNIIKFSNENVEAAYQQHLNDIRNITLQEETLFSSQENIETRTQTGAGVEGARPQTLTGSETPDHAVSSNTEPLFEKRD